MSDVVLVTGVGGFLGAALEARAAAAGARVVGVGRRRLRGPDHHALDLAAGAGGLAALLREHRPAVVFHLAGGRGEDPFSAHLPPTRHLLAALRACGAPPPRVVVAGSAAEYGDLGAEPVAEDAREQPASEYGVAKLAQTRLALLARREGVPLVVARLFNVIGPGMSPALAPARFAAEARAALAAGRGEITVGDLAPVRDYLDVDDAARALWTLGAVEQSEPIVNVCSGRGIAMDELAGEILRQLGARLALRRDPGLARGAAEVPVSVGCDARLRAATGQRFTLDLPRAVERLLRGAPVPCRAHP